MSSHNAGILYLVATPIGNLDDMSQRALNTLREVDLILAEDTRHSKPLLSHFMINQPLQSLHAHNEKDRSAYVVKKLQQGKNIALISDAGTPLISDPGYPLVRMAREQGIKVCPIPGACALVSALCASGIASDNFLFLGFLSAKQVARQKQLQLHCQYSYTTVFYESTHRIYDFIEDVKSVLGSARKLTLAKELTKTFETFVYGVADDILSYLDSDSAHKKGEFVVVIEGQAPTQDTTQAKQLLTTLLNYLPVKQAAKLAAELSDINKNEAYQIALELKK